MLDEVQKIPRWSDMVKWLWDQDSVVGIDLRVLLLGSSPLLMQRGLSDSLAGRFETIPLPHWSLVEMQEAFGFSLEQYVFFGAYPGAAHLVEDEERWRRYILDALIETTVSRDILLMTRVDKPALLRRLFDLGCSYSGQILSYQKMIGQLQDVGNTTTLAHYLQLLAAAGLLTGLQKYAGQRVRRRGSSPKLQVLNTALMSAVAGRPFAAVRQDPERWGRLVESAVGAHLVNSAQEIGGQIFYWRDRGREVDFVVEAGDALLAIEVKSGRAPDVRRGARAFGEAFPGARFLLVGGGGIPVEQFLTTPFASLLALI